jgi:hypothetical protein
MTPPKNEDQGVEAQLAVINVKLDLLIEQRSDHEERIRSLEQFKWLLAGVCAAAGGGAGAVMGKLLG